MPTGLHSLYRNNGDGTFTDVSEASGIAKIKGRYGLTPVAADFDEDGWPDIFVACDTSASLLLMNNHDGTFREEGVERGAGLNDDGVEQAGMGVGIGDYNLDGHLDLFKAHFTDDTSALYRNDGKGNFSDVTLSAGLGVGDALSPAGAPASSIWTTTATPTCSWSPATSIRKSTAKSPATRTRRRA